MQLPKNSIHFIPFQMPLATTTNGIIRDGTGVRFHSSVFADVCHLPPLTVASWLKEIKRKHGYIREQCGQHLFSLALSSSPFEADYL